jgi:hypothetical protein
MNESLSTEQRGTFWVTMPGRGFYFRLRGYGLAVDRDLPVCFSERYGHRNVLRIGRWALQFLRPPTW